MQPDDPKNPLDKPKVERASKGTKGLTTHGAKMLRNACYLLEKVYGRKRLSLVTPTLPEIPQYLPLWISNYPEIERRFIQEIRRELERKGAPTHIAGCTELHPERSKRLGYGVPHSHYVMVAWDGKSYTQSGKIDFYISADKFREIWLRTLEAYTRHSGLYDVSVPIPHARISTEVIKKSAESYISKYVSKGKKYVESIVKDDLPIEIPPCHWWHCSRELSAAIRENIRDVPSDILKAILDGVDLVLRGVASYLKPIKKVVNRLVTSHQEPLNPYEVSNEYTVGWSFKLTKAYRRRLPSELIQVIESG